MSEETRFDKVVNDTEWLIKMANAFREEASRLEARAEKIEAGVELEDKDRGCANPLCTQWYCSCIACTWC